MSKKVWLLDLIISILLPWLIYDQLHDRGFSETAALLWSALPPLVWSLVELIWHRRMDIISGVSLLGIVLSIGAMWLGGSPRLILVRESFITGALGVVALATLLLKRPALYYLAKAMVAREGEATAKRFEQQMESTNANVAMRTLTLVWGSAMVFECVLRVCLAFTLPLETVLIVSPVIFYVVMGGLAAWTLLYRKHLRKQVGR
ncbi:hypothetical protein LIN78_10200 [Leeia sp. TBRC 13508]|uniref:Transmembrane protein n=1 Tax=Leeia speluncae TaxID=2884804 RepID=A0ABS8D6T8_9NEIS|nr:VC0807 family protein [Leeia speluncae]MCB6183914.1 hypothetical protein [Leeia speluncae]